MNPDPSSLTTGHRPLATSPGHRFLLWVDAVGGYWVCLGDTIVLGQPDPRGSADVPILGDLSRQHARLERSGEGFLIEALAETLVDGRPVRQSTWLHDGSRIQLGRSVQMVFRRPHALSATARFDFVSRHRTQPLTDGVLWMADTCVLGPRRQCHVLCHHWPHEVVLYRSAEHLYCRTRGVVEIDGTACDSRGRITQNSHVLGEGFSFNLEAMQ